MTNKKTDELLHPCKMLDILNQGVDDKSMELIPIIKSIIADTSGVLDYSLHTSSLLEQLKDKLDPSDYKLDVLNELFCLKLYLQDSSNLNLDTLTGCSPNAHELLRFLNASDSDLWTLLRAYNSIGINTLLSDGMIIQTYRSEFSVGIKNFEGDNLNNILIYIKKYLQYIDFENCKNIKNLQGLENGVEHIDIYACSSFESLFACPDSVQTLSVGECPKFSSFQGCSKNIKDISLGGCPNLCSLDGIPASVEKIQMDRSLYNQLDAKSKEFLSSISELNLSDDS